MRWLINYLRQCFCKHEFTRDQISVFNAYSNSNRPDYYEVHFECKKCGYHKKYKK
jgi:hypothetical protein